jgi:hypothetical protein
MSYCIFLKSLRILEEFRKNPHIKIPPKSTCIKFQSLCKFKNPILIQKDNISWLSAQSVQQPASPLGLFGPTGPAGFLPPPTPYRAGASATIISLVLPPWPCPDHLRCKRKKMPHTLLYILPIKRHPPSSFPLPVNGSIECLHHQSLKAPRPLAS